jgi:peptide/nickel transport system substrate-binding protein
VLYTYNAYVNEKSVGQSTIFRDVDKFEAPDKFTFKITTKKPVAYLLYSLSAPLAFVIAKEARERSGGLKPDPPIGTGPFIMKEHKFRSTLTYDKNPEYFIQGRPYLDGVDMTWLADPSTAIAAYRTGQIDTIMYATVGPWTTFLDILKTEGWSAEGGKTDARVMQQNAGGNQNFLWRVDQPPFQDARVRQALSMALDRDKMVTAVWGKGYYSQSFPTDWMHKPDKPWPWSVSDFPETYHYNPDKAKALLSQAGFDAGQKLDIVVPTSTGTASGPTADAAALVQEAWKKIGVDSSISVMDSVAYDALQFGKKWQPNQVLAGAHTSGGLDLDDFTYRLLRTGQQANYGFVSDPQLDALLDAQQAEFDRPKREDLARQIAERDFEQIYRLFTVTNLFWELKRPYVQNWASHDVYMWMNGWGLDNVQEVWLDR